ncbi:MAG: alpha/beta hydrolase, partial [Desulfococcaceae bacterium]
MARKIDFPAGKIRLEGLLAEGAMDRGVVVTHPHPLYGGEMRNPVVETVADVYARRGLTSLRFNFRGVGGSGGSYDDGRGEMDDVRAAVAYLRERGVQKIDLAGYSFGAWVAARMEMEAEGVDRLILVSPPVDFLSFADVDRLPRLALTVVGDEDDFGATERVRALATRWNPDARFEI